MYVINIDKPNQTRLHLAATTDKRCQTQEKNGRDGLWPPVDAIQDAFEVADRYSVKLVACKIFARKDEGLRLIERTFAPLSVA